MVSSTDQIAGSAPAVVDLNGPDGVSTLSTTPAFHIPCLDGIRACAILLVFLGHSGFDNFIPGGFGVTVFFLLSGYLITTLLRREFTNQGRINLGKFYLRRVLRIFPPMYLTLAFALLMSYAGVAPFGWQTRAVMAHIIHITNYWTINHGYAGLLTGMGVLWSLAVEEHFYLLFPWIAIFLMRRFGARTQSSILGVACLAILAWRCLLVFYFHSPAVRTFKATDTRIDSILFGCILALFHNPVLDPVKVRRTRTKWLILLASGLVLVTTFIYRSEAFRESIRYSCQGLALLALFYIAISNPRWPLFSWLDWPPMRALGILSYSLYLIHFWAINVILYHRPGIGRILLAVGAAFTSMTFAVIMYYAVERPCARLRKRLHA